MKKASTFILIVFLFGVIHFVYSYDKYFPIKAVQLGQTTLSRLEIADTQAKQEQGLSGRQYIAANYGMFFVFQNPGFYSFWMKDMKFSIDIIWLDKNGTIVGLTQSASPQSYPQEYISAHPASYVLEAQAGLTQKENLKIGDSVKFIR